MQSSRRADVGGAYFHSCFSASMVRLYGVFVLLLAVGAASASVAVSGTVYSRCNDLVPVPDFEVLLSVLATGQTVSTTTDAEGRYVFNGVQENNEMAVSGLPTVQFKSFSPITFAVQDVDETVDITLIPVLTWAAPVEDLSFTCEETWWNLDPPPYKCFCTDVQVLADSEPLPEPPYSECFSRNVTWVAATGISIIGALQVVSVHNTDFYVDPPAVVTDWPQCAAISTNLTGVATVKNSCFPVELSYSDRLSYSYCPSQIRVERTWTGSSCGNMVHSAIQYIYHDVAPAVIATPPQPYVGYCSEYSRDWVTNHGGAVFTVCDEPIQTTAEVPPDCNSYITVTGSNDCDVPVSAHAEFVIVARPNSTTSHSWAARAEEPLVLAFGDEASVRFGGANQTREFETVPVDARFVEAFAITVVWDSYTYVCLYTMYGARPTITDFDAMICTTFDAALTWIAEEVQTGVYYSLLVSQSEGGGEATIDLVGSSNDTMAFPWPMPERVCQDKCVGYENYW